MSLNILEQPPQATLVANFWNSPDDALFSQKTVAAILGLTEAWCERARWAGEGPPYLKLSRAVRYRKRGIVAWIEQRERSVPASEIQAA